MTHQAVTKHRAIRAEMEAEDTNLAERPSESTQVAALVLIGEALGEILVELQAVPR